MSLSLTPFFGNNLWPSTWNSFDRELDRDMARMHRLINDTTHHFTPDQDGVYHRQPNYSYEENDEHAHLEVELPGVSKDNVDINIHGNSLVVSAKRFKSGVPTHVEVTQVDEDHNEQPTSAKKTKSEEKDKDKDKDTGPKPSVIYQLKLRIGQKFDAENIHANMEGDGLLKMTIPLKAKDTVRPIQIQSANM